MTQSNRKSTTTAVTHAPYEMSEAKDWLIYSSIA